MLPLATISYVPSTPSSRRSLVKKVMTTSALPFLLFPATAKADPGEVAVEEFDRVTTRMGGLLDKVSGWKESFPSDSRRAIDESANARRVSKQTVVD